MRWLLDPHGRWYGVRRMQGGMVMPRELQLSLGLTDAEAAQVVRAAEEDGMPVTKFLNYAVDYYVGMRQFALDGGCDW